MGHRYIIRYIWTITLMICVVSRSLSAEIDSQNIPPKQDIPATIEEIKKGVDVNGDQKLAQEGKPVAEPTTETNKESIPSPVINLDISKDGKVVKDNAEHPKSPEQDQKKIDQTENKKEKREILTEEKQEQKVEFSQEEPSTQHEQKSHHTSTDRQQPEANRPCFPSEQLKFDGQNELNEDAIITNTGGKLPDHHQKQKDERIQVQGMAQSQEDKTAEKVVSVDNSKKEDKKEEKSTADIDAASKALEPPVISEKGTIDDGAGGAGLPDMPGKDDVIEPPKQSEDMPSFGEWKQKMLEEEEKTKQREALTTNNGGSPVKPVKSNMKRVNYAAMQCGAKVLASNPEAQNPSSILNENKDQYIINPCKAKKWVVVELCEPIQVRNIEIANLELFSSLPESFVISISDRYPTKEWNAIGTLHAREERTVQSFSLNDEEMFAKFVKIEMLTHYGKEHYCPLTLFRVYGTTGEEDDDSPDSTEDEGEGQNADKDKETNLFTTATNTVLTLMKSVLGEEEPPKVEDLEKVISLNATALNASIVNATKSKNNTAGPCAPDANSVPSGSEGKETKPSDQPETPCVRDRESGSTNSDSKASTSPGAPSTDTPPIKKTTEPPPDINDDIKKLVTLIETPTLPLRITLGNCNFCEKKGLNQSAFDMSTSCGYYRLLSYKYPTTCAIKKSKRPTVEKLDTKSDVEEKIGNIDEAKKTESVISMSPTVTASEHIPVSVEATVSHSVEVVPSVSASQVVEEKHTSSIVIAPSSAEAIPASEVKPTPTLQESKSFPSQKDSDEASVQGTQSTHTADGTKPRETIISQGLETNKKLENSVVESKPTTVQETVKKEEACDESKQGGKSGEEPCTMGPKVVQIRPTTTTTDLPTATEDLKIPAKETDGNTAEKSRENVKEAEKTDPSTATGTGEDKGTEKPATDTATSGGGVEEKGTKPEGSNGMKDIYAESTPSSGEFILEPVPVPDTNEPVQKLSSGKRETTVMRLKNRIKQLEVNLNLSSRYLEELSQRYKKHMEEMYNSLNKTIARLSDTARSAAIRDEKQQEHITMLQKKLENVTDIVEQLSENMAGINSQVIERHLYLMFIEVVVFLLALAWCMNRQTYRIPPQYTSASSAYSSSTSSSGVEALANSNPHHRPRRSSIGTDTPTKRNCSKVRLKRQTQSDRKITVDDMALVRSGSESDLHIIEPNINLFLSETTSHSKQSQPVLPKKKKKKRYSGRQSWDKQSSTDLISSGSEKNISNSGGNLIEAAGILFGGKGSVQKEPLVNGSASNSSLESNSIGNLTSWSHTSLKSRGSQSYSSLVSSKSNSRTDIKQVTLSKTNSAVNGHSKAYVTNIGRRDVYYPDSGTQSTVKHNTKKGSPRNSSPCGLN